MMKALLLAGGASVAYAQCSLQNTTNCTFATSGQNCTVYPATTGTCFRRQPMGLNNVTACDNKDATTCTAPFCAAGTTALDGKTCSKCEDSCSKQTTNDTCTGAASMDACTWFGAQPAYCGATLAPSPCYSSTTAATCVMETGCFWASWSTTVCGSTKAGFTCSPCDVGAYKDVRSALKNKGGMKCTWAAGSITVNAVTAQGTDTAKCTAFSAPAEATDNAALIKGALDGLFGFKTIEVPTTVTCAVPSSGASLIPSLAILGLVAAVVA